MNDPTSTSSGSFSLATTLAAQAYTDPSVFDAEKDRIFYRSWQYIGPESWLGEGGDYLTGEVVNERIFVIRTTEGELKAFYNVCKHRAHGLLHGRGRVRRVICPNHGWSYSIDGQLHAAPGCERVPGFEPSKVALSSVRVETLKGLVFVNLDPQALSLGKSYPGLAKELEELVPELDRLEWCPPEVVASDLGGPLARSAELHTNWKVLLDNCVECYHCRIAHPAFADLVDLETYRIKDNGTFTTHVGNCVRPDNRSAYRFNESDTVQRIAFWHLWPNTVITLYPGVANMGVFKFTPTRHDLTRIHSDSFRRPGPMSDVERDRIRYIANILWPEDVAICESVWRGLHSRSYDGGLLMLNGALDAVGEDSVRLFHRMWARSMER
jgi:phenylpropionate dioxygenase-like ring-hydroxylating dioxygenase large terminal subunit